MFSYHSFLLFYCLLRIEYFLIWNWQITLNKVSPCIFPPNLNHCYTMFQRKLALVSSASFPRVWSHHILESRAENLLDWSWENTPTYLLNLSPLLVAMWMYQYSNVTFLMNKWMGHILWMCGTRENTPQNVLHSPTLRCWTTPTAEGYQWLSFERTVVC